MLRALGGDDMRPARLHAPPGLRCELHSLATAGYRDHLLRRHPLPAQQHRAEGYSGARWEALYRSFELATEQPLSPAAGLALADELLTGADPDVRSVAERVCRELAIPLRWSPADPLRENERAAPALAATLRALAQGSLPLDAAGARAALHEAAGGLAEPEALAGGRAELAARSGAVPPRPVAPQTPAVVLPPAIAAQRRRRLAIGAGIAAAVVILGGIGVLGWSTAGHREPTGPVAASRAPSPAARATFTPSPLPSLPATDGPIKSVAETPQSTCEPGSRCRIEVDVHFVKTDSPLVVTWQFELVDSCTSEVTYVDGSSVKALKGWVHVVGDTDVTLPAGHPLAVVAVTTEPSHAASAPLLVTGGTC
jgi:hypothetical protein